jgi:hypothetical protein
MKRRVCSYDMFAVPDPCFVLKDTVGEMYFCSSRCFCVWSVQLATRSNLPEEHRAGVYLLVTPTGEEHQFSGIVEVARWAAAFALDQVTSHEPLHPPEGNEL